MAFARPSEWKNPSEKEYLHINYSRESNIWALWLNYTSANAVNKADEFSRITKLNKSTEGSSYNGDVS